MENYYVEKGEYIPEIKFDAETGIMEISGDSYHEYTNEFFEPIFEWLEKYLEQEGRNIVFNFRMTYFNTASSKCFFDIIELLQEYRDAGKGKVEVNWFYEENDLDMLETGEEYIQDSGMKEIRLIPY